MSSQFYSEWRAKLPPLRTKLRTARPRDAIGIRELPVPSAIRRFMQVDVLRILKKREAPSETKKTAPKRGGPVAFGRAARFTARTRSCAGSFAKGWRGVGGGAAPRHTVDRMRPSAAGR